MNRSRLPSKYAILRALVLIAIVILPLGAGPLSAAAQPLAAQVQDAQLQVWNRITGPGPGSTLTDNYGFWAVVRIAGDVALPALSDIHGTVNGQELPARNVFAEPRAGATRIQANFRTDLPPLSSPPPAGQYAITIDNVTVDGVNEGTIGPVQLGTLEDYPRGAPAFLTPTANELQNGITDTEPGFSWEPFTTTYNGQAKSPEMYDLSIEFPSSDLYDVQLAGTEISSAYVREDWSPSQPQPLVAGDYNLALQSFFHAAPTVTIINWRLLDLTVVPNTPVGQFIIVSLPAGVTVQFDRVGLAGSTTAQPTDADPMLSGFGLVSKAIELTSSAEFDKAQVCMPYDPTGLSPIQQTQLTLYHEENGVWKDITGVHWPNAHQVCGYVTSFSPFAVLLPTRPTKPDQCKKDGWTAFTEPRLFKSQGDCIQFVNTGK